ncbi:MAG TPA: D-alanine--D-alanine ligase [Solirubrobacteraceae bacterium]|nr:D-alanine--D-alanine ligase [Solirubrobacteraceae bacterium]
MSDGRATVAVLHGGRSLERAVSLRSGARVAAALSRLGHEVLTIDPGPALVEELIAGAPQAAFITLHGRDGEDGTVQSVLEAIDLPYTGSGPAACQRCIDKGLAKRLIAGAGLPTPAFRTLTEDAVRELGAAAALDRVWEEIGPQIVVKPARGGSALGVKFVRDAAELPAAMVGAFSYDDGIVLERFVRGRDLAVAVLGDGADAEVLPIVEAVPRDRDFYDYEARYEIGRTSFECPAELPDETRAAVGELARAVHALLGCRGVSRVDVMLDEALEPWVLEVNVVPGMTETSLLPQAADAAGVRFDELVARILAGARA